MAAPAGRFGGPVALADLAGEVGLPSGREHLRAAVPVACRAAGFEPDIRYVSGETGVVLAAVLAAGAVALVPRLGLAGLPPGIDVLPVAHDAVRRRVFAAHRHGSAGRPAWHSVLARLRAAAACQRAGRAGHGITGGTQDGIAVQLQRQDRQRSVVAAGGELADPVED